jgi:hypothetical protein
VPDQRRRVVLLQISHQRCHGLAQVPVRTQTLFKKYDTDGTGSMSFEELSKALCEEFPSMPEYAREHLPVGFKQYAGSNGELDLNGFMKMHAAFLFRNFDVDANGVLELSEVRQAAHSPSLPFIPSTHIQWGRLKCVVSPHFHRFTSFTCA